MPALLPTPDLVTTDDVSADHPTPARATGADPAPVGAAPETTSGGNRIRSGRKLLTALIGLAALSTAFLVVLAIVALTDSGDPDEARDATLTAG